ncbi:MAG: DUF1194 domain-containing protein [Pseudomonas sp.]|jgi:hypothetical protein|uniref:DUF1194 domain-containing protein n=1 Tax=Pseudomonas sp. TaxID=306 RepID=UPI003981CE21
MFAKALRNSLLVAAIGVPQWTWAVAVDTELQLLMDVSGSVNSFEYGLQLQGYIDAFSSQSVQNTILDTSAGKFGSIAVQMVMWSGANQQTSVTEWTLLDSTEAINNFTYTLANVIRPYSNMTAPGSALLYGAGLFADNGFEGTRQVIDVSGDGIQNSGFSTAEARDAALAQGIDTINGITIGQDYAAGELQQWYVENVAGGTNAFVMNADTFSDFGQALELKLAAEIDGSYVPEAALPAPIEDIPWQGQLGLLGLLGWFFWYRDKLEPAAIFKA